MTKVVHLSTAHGRRELRVHLKECNSLAAAGYEVHYIVADGLGYELVGEVSVHDIGKAGGRFKRMLMRPWKMLYAARKLKAGVYHFHDPELLLIALFLRENKASVIYDSHEDVPRTILSREWIPGPFRLLLSTVFEMFENFVARRLSAIVCATPHITERFLAINKCSITVNNYPLMDEMKSQVSGSAEANNICYLGGISRLRGIEEMVRALEYVDARLILAGPFDSAETEQAVRRLPGWSKVDYKGKVSRLAVQEIMSISHAGLVFFHPEPNHVNAQPNKMFEYMSAGLPVLASNFPLWQRLIEQTGAGLVADPLDPQAIAQSIHVILNDPEKSKKMGDAGRDTVIKNYTWEVEATKLFDLYSLLLNDDVNVFDKVKQI